MNTIINDNNESVIAVGAPGSIERCKVQYPNLIKELDSLYYNAYECHGRGIDEAIQMIRTAGVSSYVETINILSNTRYADEPRGSITKFVMSL